VGARLTALDRERRGYTGFASERASKTVLFNFLE
jgi:hypothetical protein